MKKLLVLLLVVFGFSLQSKASHVMGSDITYECLPNGQYVFTVTIYRDCAGANLGATTSLSFNSPSCGLTFNVVLVVLEVVLVVLVVVLVVLEVGFFVVVVACNYQKQGVEHSFGSCRDGPSSGVVWWVVCSY